MKFYDYPLFALVLAGLASNLIGGAGQLSNKPNVATALGVRAGG
jgi:hypothetical protein